MDEFDYMKYAYCLHEDFLRGELLYSEYTRWLVLLNKEFFEYALQEKS